MLKKFKNHFGKFNLIAVLIYVILKIICFIFPHWSEVINSITHLLDYMIVSVFCITFGVMR